MTRGSREIDARISIGGAAHNIADMLLAALGFLSPLLAAAAMAFSGTTVIGNSLRAKRRLFMDDLGRRTRSTFAEREECLFAP